MLLKRPIAFILVLLTAFSLSANAQIKVEPSYFLLGEEELSGVDIYSLLQDQQKNYWIATNNGLYKYDGYEFSRRLNEEMLSSSLFGLKEDKNGIVYCHNLSGQIFSIEQDSLQLKFEVPDSLMYHSFEFGFDQNNTLIVMSNIIFSVNRGVPEILYDESGYLTGALFESKKGLVVVNSNNNDLIYINNGKIEVQKNEVETTEKLTPVFVELKDNFYALNLETNRVLNDIFFEEACPSIINQLPVQGRHFMGSDGEILWMGKYNGGSTAYNHLLEPLFNGSNLFNSIMISAATRDVENNILLGTFGHGVIVIPNPHMVDIKLNLQVGSVKRISISSKGEVYLGTIEGNVLKLSEDGSIFDIIGDGFKMIECMELVDYENSLLVDAKTSILIDLKNLKDQSLDLGSIKDIYPMNNGKYAVATNQAIHVFDRNTNQRTEKGIYFEKVPAFTERTNCVGYDSINELFYVGSSKGLKIGSWDTASYFKFQGSDLLCRDFVGIGSRMYVATQGEGVIIFENGKQIDQWNSDTNLNSDFCLHIRTYQDQIFVATDQGINVISNTGEPAYIINRSNGLKTNALIDFEIHDNYLWMLHNQGIQRLDLNHFEPFTPIPEIRFQSILVNEVQLDDLSKNEFDHNTNKFTFTIAAPTLKFNTELKIQYKLSGIDNNWQINDYEDNTIEYKALVPGHYNFMVKVKYRDIESETIQYSFTILKPFWARWWFYLLIGLFLVSSTSIIVVFVNRRQRKKALIEKELIASKLTAIQSQMNPHFIFNSLNSIQDLVLQQDGKKAYTYISKFAFLVRKILDHSQRDFIDIEEEVKVLEVYLELELLRFKDDFKFSIETNQVNELKIPPLIIQPFVENAIKHGLLHKDGPKNLRISYQFKNDLLLCEIEDNGIGIEASQKIKARQKHSHESFSVKSVERRFDILKKLYGDGLGLEIVDLNKKSDNEGSGTLIILKLPFKRDF